MWFSAVDISHFLINCYSSSPVNIGAWLKKGSGTVVRSTLRAVPATVPDPFLNHAKIGLRGRAEHTSPKRQRGTLPFTYPLLRVMFTSLVVVPRWRFGLVWPLRTPKEWRGLVQGPSQTYVKKETGTTESEA